MSMLEFPTFEEMVQVMNSPSAPPSPMDHAEYLSSQESEMEMSTDDMVKATFLMVRKIHKEKAGQGLRSSIHQDAILMDNPLQT